MKHFLQQFALVLCLGSTTILHAEEAVGGEPIEADAIPPEEPLVQQDELALSQSELLPKANQMLSIGIGAAMPWQNFNVQWGLRKSADELWHFSAGGGNDVLTGRSQLRSYELEVRSQSLVGGIRYFFSERFPFYAEPLISFVQWDGDISPKGSDPATDTVAAKLDSGFSGQGVIFGGNLGFIWLWENGFFVDYSIFRLGKAWALKISTSTDSDETRAAVKDNLQRWLSWDFANITVGYFF